MTDTLLIRLAEGARGFRDWLLADEQGRAKGPVQRGVPEAGVLAAQHQVRVLVPGSEVLLTRARVPLRNRKRALRAIPYALEEELAADVEQLHFAAGPMQDEGEYPVAVVERARMDAWGELLREHGITAAQWIPETLALEPAGEAWRVLAEADRLLVRSGDYAGFATDCDNLELLLDLFAEREQAPEKLLIHGRPACELAPRGVEVEVVEDPLLPLELLALGCARGPVIDLLQGPYSRREEWGRLLRPWRATAALLLAAVVLGGVATAIDYYRLTQQQQALKAEIEALYRKTFPNARRIVNPRAQMEQKLKALQRRAGRGGGDFMTLLAETAAVVRATRGITVRGASYRDGRIDLDLQADNLQVLDKLKQALTGSGNLRAEIQSASTEADKKVTGRMRIQRAGA
ncbi:MAG TPA: type II secretion system protein GspL [Gammaproteobacteria bacterium]|nr:type II secretion system protein GspL [Gammaproteobacteria bacterium]